MAIGPEPASEKTWPSDGTVSSASTMGKTQRAKMVHASQVFSHAHFLVNFMGRVKLPFIAPARMSSKIPIAAWFID